MNICHQQCFKNFIAKSKMVIVVSRKELISTLSSNNSQIHTLKIVLQEHNSNRCSILFRVSLIQQMHEVRVEGRINHIPEPEFRIYISMGTQQWKRHVYSCIFCSNFQRLIVCNFHNQHTWSMELLRLKSKMCESRD